MIKEAAKKFGKNIYYRQSTSTSFLEVCAVTAAYSKHLISTDVSNGVLNALLAFKGVQLLELAKPQKIRAGEHLSVKSRRYHGFTKRKLSTGTAIYPGDKIGDMSFIRNIATLKPDENVTVFSRHLFKEAKQDLTVLAGMCVENDARLKGINFFTGISHLAQPELCERLGFEFYKVRNPLEILGGKGSRKLAAGRVGRNNEMWKKMNKASKSINGMVITRQRLIDLYYKQPPV